MEKDKKRNNIYSSREPTRENDGLKGLNFFKWDHSPLSLIPIKANIPVKVIIPLI